MMTPRRPLDYLLLLTSLALVIGLIVLMLLPEGRVPMMGAHPEFFPMLKSNHNISAQPSVFPWAIFFCLSILAMIASLIWLGNLKGGERGPVGTWLMGGFAVYVFFWLCMLYAYTHYSGNPDPSYWWQFPSPTAWMLYPIWLFPLALAGITMYFFERWTFTPEDQQTFDALVQEVKQLQADGSTER